MLIKQQSEYIEIIIDDIKLDPVPGRNAAAGETVTAFFFENCNILSKELIGRINLFSQHIRGFSNLLF